MLDAFLHALSAIFVLAFVAGMGGYATRKGIFDEKGRTLLSKTIGLALPFYLFSVVTSRFTHEQILELARIAGLPFLAFALFTVISIGFCRAGLVRREWQGTFVAQFSGSSILYVGIPVILALIGETGIPGLLVYFFANVIFIWTVGLYGIQLDGVRRNGGMPPPMFSAKNLKMIFTKPLLGFLAGLACVLAGLAIPSPVAMATKLIGQICSPLALLFIGITIYQIGFRRFARLPRETWLILAACNVIRPALMFLLTLLLDMDPLMRQVLIISSAMPVSPMTGVLAKMHDGPAEFASATVGVSVAALAVTLPFIMLAVSMIR